MNAKTMVPKISTWIKESVDKVLANLKGNCATFFYPLDDDTQIAIGWGPGYDPDDNKIIVDPENAANARKNDDTCYGLSIKVCANDRDEYECLIMPWNTEQAARLDKHCVEGDVYDTELPLCRHKGYGQVAAYMYKQYKAIAKGIEDGTLTYGN